MKVNFNYTFQKLLRRNFIYFVTLLGITFLFLIGLFFFSNKHKENNLEIQKLQMEIAQLQKKKELLDFKDQVLRDEIDLDKINAVLTQLIPNQEDFFSIIATIEKLSQQSNFLITSYNLNLSKSEVGSLSIITEGTGNPESFLEFLKNYNFGGGRLVTIDKIQFNQEIFVGTKINLTVYSGKGSADASLSTFGREDKLLIETILKKVELELKSEDESTDYPIKSNPF